METKKEERSEYVGIYVTKEVAKQLKEASDNNILKDKILKQFVEYETEWLKDEIKNMDEITTIYRAKLLTIRDNFSKAQDIYVDEVEALIRKSADAIKPINDLFVPIQDKLKESKAEVKNLSDTITELKKSLGYIDYSNLEKLLDLVDRFNKMNEKEKELLMLIMKK